MNVIYYDEIDDAIISHDLKFSFYRNSKNAKNVTLNSKILTEAHNVTLLKIIRFTTQS